jgi:hypothetical protein
MQSPIGRNGKRWYQDFKNVPVTDLEVWEGYWYANQYWYICKVQITWADGTRAALAPIYVRSHTMPSGWILKAENASPTSLRG